MRGRASYEHIGKRRLSVSVRANAWSTTGMVCGPSGRGDVCDAVNGSVCEAGQDVGQVVADRDLEPSTAFHNREDGSYPWPSLLAADMDPVGAANGDWAH